MAQESFIDTFLKLTSFFFQIPHLVSIVESKEDQFSKHGHHVITFDGLWTRQEARCFP